MGARKPHVMIICERCGKPSNLEIVNQSDHVREHHAEMLAARKEKAGY
jgi:hypothetical protein